MSDSSDSKTDQLNEEDEFYDATDRLEKLDVNKSNSEIQAETTKSKTEETDKETDSEPKFVPLHEELNSKLKSKLEEGKNSDEEDEKEETNVIGSDEDQFFIDENLLKEQEEKLTEDEKAKNLEEALANKQQGNDAFKEAKYIEALESYTKALRICPYSNNKERAVFYSNRAICFFKTKDYERCIKECTTAIDLDPTFLKPLLRRADCYEASDKLDEALEDYKKLLALEPNAVSHKSKCYELEQKVKERNEKLKDEMMGKLKDLGNMVLKPFGLSTSNFEFVQDPNTGSYSVNFKK